MLKTPKKPCMKGEKHLWIDTEEFTLRGERTQDWFNKYPSSCCFINLKIHATGEHYTINMSKSSLDFIYCEKRQYRILSLFTIDGAPIKVRIQDYSNIVNVIRILKENLGYNNGEFQFLYNKHIKPNEANYLEFEKSWDRKLGYDGG